MRRRDVAAARQKGVGLVIAHKSIHFTIELVVHLHRAENEPTIDGDRLTVAVRDDVQAALLWLSLRSARSLLRHRVHNTPGATEALLNQRAEVTTRDVARLYLFNHGAVQLSIVEKSPATNLHQ